MLIAAATDVALVLDGHGVIRDFAFSGDDLYPALPGYETWIGRNWADIVTSESRRKVEALVHEALSNGSPRWRQLNHASVRGTDVPILYSTIQIGGKERLVAFGRDVREVSALQQRLVDAQQSLESDYARLRHVEARYRLLFQMSAEAVLIIDSATEKVMEANPAARQMFGDAGGRMQGRPLRDLFDAQAANEVRNHLASVRGSGKAGDLQVYLAHPEREVKISTRLFRQENSSFYLVQLSGAPEKSELHSVPSSAAKLVKVVENAPDGLVVTDLEQRIIAANEAFLGMIQMTAEDQVTGQPLDRWVGRPGVDLHVLIANLRQRGSVRLFATTLRGEFGGSVGVEISAASIANGSQPSFGFWIRNVDRRLSSEGVPARALPRSVEQLKELVGRVSLKELVRESTHLIERLSIEAALELTNDNRASAAEMLGLSRQSLYVKLRRYNLGDLALEGKK